MKNVKVTDYVNKYLERTRKKIDFSKWEEMCTLPKKLHHPMVLPHKTFVKTSGGQEIEITN